MGLLPAACCMYLHGIYLCIPDGVISFLFLSDREARGPRITTTLLAKTQIHACGKGIVLVWRSSGLQGIGVQLSICIVQLGKTFVAK